MSLTDGLGPVFTNLITPYISPALSLPPMAQTPMFGGVGPPVQFGTVQGVTFGDAPSFQVGRAESVFQVGKAVSIFHSTPHMSGSPVRIPVVVTQGVAPRGARIDVRG